MSRRPGAHGGDPDAPRDEGLSIFGPLELPRDETELLPAYDEHAPYGDGGAGGTRVATPSMLPPPHPGAQPGPYPGPYPGPPPGPPPVAPPVHPGSGAPGHPPPPYPPPGPAPYPPPHAAGPPPPAAPQTPDAQATQVFPESLFRDELPAAGHGPGPGAGHGPALGHHAGVAHGVPASGYPAPGPPPHVAPPHYAGQPQYSAPAVPGRRAEAVGGSGGSGRGTGQGLPRAAVTAGVVGVVVVLLAVIVFASGMLGGDDDSKNAAGGGASTNAASATPSASASVSASASPSAPATSATPKSQAQQLDELFEVSAGSRTTVQEAVREIQKCGDIAGAVKSLDEAAAQRDRQVATLGTLEFDEIARGDELARHLREAWKASAKADREYAAWGRESAKGACEDGKSARRTDSRKDGDAASKDATEAKNKAVALWNPEATKAGLKTRTAGEI